MALALSLVGQPVQPYLTTGATDFVNSVQKGKEDAIKTEELKTQSQKSALDLLTAQKKQKDEQWYSDNAGALSRKVKTLDVADEDLAKMAQVNPEYHKVLQTEKADAVKNFNASNLAYLGSSADKAKSAQEIIQASEAHGMTIPDQFKQSPETLMQYLKVINAGSKAFDLKNVSKDESGDIITTDITGNTTDIKPAAVKAAKATPVIKNGKRVTQTISLPNGRTRTEQLMSDDTWQELDTSAPPAPKAEKTPSGDLVQTANGWEFVPKGQIPKGAPVVKKPEAPSGEESSSAGYAFRMGEANKILTDFESNKKGLPSYIPSMASGVPLVGDYLENVTQNEDQQLYRNAALAWIRAKLRDESGATIQDVESSNEYKTYFPVMGDTEAKIKQKAKLREIAEAEMMLKAGKASTKLEETRKNYNAKNPPAKNAQGWTLHTDKYGNKAYVSPDGKQYQKVQ